MRTSTYRAGAFVSATRTLGLELTVGLPEENYLAKLDPAGNITVPFDDLDEAARVVSEYAREHPIHGIVSLDAHGVVAAAAIGKALGLPANPPDAAAATQDKLEQRKRFAHDAALGSPRFVLVTGPEEADRAADAIGFPCVVKPRFLAASQGVIRADDRASLEAALSRSSAIVRDPFPLLDPGCGAGAGDLGPSENAVVPLPARTGGKSEDGGKGGESDNARDDAIASLLVEEYIVGDEFAVEGVLSGGDLRVLAIFDKPDPLVGPFFEETIYVTPSRRTLDEQAAIVACAERAARALGLAEGPVHAEVRLSPRGAFIVEIAARTMGGSCSNVFRFAGGASLEEIILTHAIGRAIPEPGHAHASGVMMLPIPADGVLAGVDGQEDAAAVPGIVDVSIAVPAGKHVRRLPEGSHYLGFLFAAGQTPDEVEAALRDAFARLAVRIEKAPAR